MKNLTVTQSQDLRKEGYTIVLTSNLKKVLLATTNEDEAYKLKSEFLLKGKVVKVFGPLIKIYKNKEDQILAYKESMKALELGLNYPQAR